MKIEEERRRCINEKELQNIVLDGLGIVYRWLETACVKRIKGLLVEGTKKREAIQDLG